MNDTPTIVLLAPYITGGFTVLAALITIAVTRNTSSRDWQRQARFDAYCRLDSASLRLAMSPRSNDIMRELTNAELRFNLLASRKQVKAGKEVGKLARMLLLLQTAEGTVDVKKTAADKLAKDFNTARDDLAKATRKTLRVFPADIDWSPQAQALEPGSQSIPKPAQEPTP